MAATNGNAPKITFYTNHGCPWAHRAHITIKELGLEYEEVIIDLHKPREPWYLEVNPVGNIPKANCIASACRLHPQLFACGPASAIG
jgi:glutathione S-transferase